MSELTDRIAPTDPANLDWLLTSFARRVPHVVYALAVSVDGLTLASTEGLPPDEADQLSAITSGLVSLVVGAARCLKTERVRQTVVDMDGGVLLVMAVGDRAQLAVLASPGCDLGQTGYETALLAQRVAAALEPGARVPGQL
ncbi:roadblock/LC7 domain-containing protein [Hamadaea tsunoensis]|uniref:roadblock/LC7 domain-containing protein n=1 Tax=Hamadaea tsunoensis TaxID=53368 RepID=UPI00042295C2|nr:roadblock/LC7 domain-containing protein [Hamadaea tsunoensis]